MTQLCFSWNLNCMMSVHEAAQNQIPAMIYCLGVYDGDDKNRRLPCRFLRPVRKHVLLIHVSSWIFDPGKEKIVVDELHYISSLSKSCASGYSTPRRGLCNIEDPVEVPLKSIFGVKIVSFKVSGASGAYPKRSRSKPFLFPMTGLSFKLPRAKSWISLCTTTHYCLSVLRKSIPRTSFNYEEILDHIPSS